MSSPVKLERIRTRPYLSANSVAAIGTVYVEEVDANNDVTGYRISGLTSNFVRNAKFIFEQPGNETIGLASVVVANGSIEDVFFYDSGRGYNVDDVLGYIYPVTSDDVSSPLNDIVKTDNYTFISDITILTSGLSAVDQRNAANEFDNVSFEDHIFSTVATLSLTKVDTITYTNKNVVGTIDTLTFTDFDSTITSYVPLIYDAFIDSNGTLLESHTPNINTPGDQWDVEVYPSTTTIENNQCHFSASSTSATFADHMMIETGTDQHQVNADITFSPDVGPGNEGIFVRGWGSSNHWMAIAASSGTLFALYTRTSGAYTLRDSVACTFSGGSTYAFQLAAVGTSITASVDGSYDLSYTSSEKLGNTECGLRQHHAATPSIRTYADNFEVRQL